MNAMQTEHAQRNPAPFPDGYRMTELGPLPEEWQVARLEEIFSIVAKKQRERTIDDDAIYRLVTVKLYAKGLVHRGIKRGQEIGVKKLYEIREGDFVFSKIDARNGAWGFVDKNLSEALVSGDFPILALNRELADANFVMLWLSRASSWKPLQNLAAGTTNRRRIQPQELLSALHIPLPPLPEQRAIAHVLRTVQRSKEATEQVIAALKELKKSLMRHLFTYGPVPVDQADRVELQETEIGSLPKHWKVVRLGEVAQKMKAGGTPRRSNPEFWGGEIPFALIKDITNAAMFITSTSKSITPEGLAKSSAWLVPPNSILITMYGTIGETAINTLSIATNQAILALVPDPNMLDVLFGAYLIKHEAGRLERENVQSTQKNVSKRILERFPIPLPPLSEQREIARILQAVDRKIEAEENRKEALEALFKSLLHDLMTARRRLPKDFVERFRENEGA